MLKDYREPEDLLSDESFLSWYSRREQQPGDDWDRWMQEEPGRTLLVRQAIELLESAVSREAELPAGQLERAEADLLKKIGSKPVSYFNWRWVAAASFLVVLAGAMIIIRVASSGQQVLVTRYGQLSERQLPDGSEVTMNANSRLRFANNWKEGGAREVWMEGEAYFHVHKTPDRSRFIVHTDRFDILVTGTQFNVVSRPGRANIMLREGSVILQAKDGKELAMVPGDFVQWDGRELSRGTAQRDSVLAWRERKLVFDRTPLKAVATLIEDQYGITVKLADPSIGDSTITGIMPNNNLEVLLQALQATTDFDVIHNDETILIRASAR